MAANKDDYFKKAGANTVTTLAAPGKAVGASSINVGSTTNYPSDTGITIAIRTVDTNGDLVAGTYTEWRGTVTSGTSIAINTTPEYGTDQIYAAGSSTQVYIPLSSAAHNDMVDGLLIEHDQQGTHTDVTATSVTAGTFTVTGQTTGMLSNVYVYTYTSPDIFINGVDQNNGANTITWTKPTNLKFIEVEVQAGGGGGGGAATATASQSAFGRGGGGGGYSYKKIAAGTLGATETITVGAGGTAGAAGNNNGGAGGNSSFGAHATANGGALGTGGASATTVADAGGGTGGTAASGTVNISGQDGGRGGRSSATNVTAPAGGNSMLGSGAPINTAFGASGSNAGGAAIGFGGGGGGAATSDSGTQKGGSVGSGGVVIVREYF